MQKKKSQLVISLLFCFLFFLNTSFVEAAELFFESKFHEFAQGDEFIVDVFLNTDNESINAVEGKVFFPSKILEIKEIRYGNSIINFWVEKPTLKQSDSIVFSGITPGGYTGAKEFLFSVVFIAKKVGDGIVEIKEGRALSNDGEGTEVSIKISPFQFSISQEILPNKFTIAPVEDTNPPEEFDPEIVQNDEMFEGKSFLIFSTQDKESGIDHYEVCEGLWCEFNVAENPYLLRNQNLDKKISIKAIDKNGNEQIEILYPLNWKPWYKDINYLIFCVAVLGGLLIIYVVRKI